MSVKERQTVLPLDLLRALAEFRYHLRDFLQFSEQVAQDNQLRPRQHQLLLQIAGIPGSRMATISFLAARLGLRQNSVVELADRSVAEGLVRRAEDPADRRRVVLSLTDKGMRVLAKLSEGHARELDEFAPRLIRALEDVSDARNGATGGSASSRPARSGAKTSKSASGRRRAR